MEDLQHAMRTNESKATTRKPTAAPRTRARRVTRTASIAAPTDDQVRVRAYEIYLRRGGRPGDPVEDWFTAERELIAETPIAAAPPARQRKSASRTRA